MNSQTEETNEKLEKLNELIERQTSWGFIFLRGIVMGLAGAIGASIIAGIVFWTLGQFFSLADLPALQELINSSTDTPSF